MRGLTTGPCGQENRNKSAIFERFHFREPMKLRRYIAFFAVLVASAVMFAHAVVPHHHRASDLSICTEAPVPCRHAQAMPGTSGTAAWLDADCDCYCRGVKCAAPLPFTLRCDSDSDDLPKMTAGLLPLFVCDFCTGYADASASAYLFSGQGRTSYFITDARLRSLWVPVSVPGRAPPVVL